MTGGKAWLRNFYILSLILANTDFERIVFTPSSNVGFRTGHCDFVIPVSRSPEPAEGEPKATSLLTLFDLFQKLVIAQWRLQSSAASAYEFEIPARKLFLVYDGRRPNISLALVFGLWVSRSK